MKEIPLTKGKVALVDDADYDELNAYSWCATSVPRKGPFAWYGVRGIRKPEGSHHSVYMHRQITQAPQGVVVDHIDNNGLNNQRSNLRLATRSQNSHNARHPRGVTGYLGVFPSRDKRCYCAAIRAHGGKRLWIGTFADAADAARARDAKAIELHGEFAILNFPREQYALAS